MQHVTCWLIQPSSRQLLDAKSLRCAYPKYHEPTWMYFWTIWLVHLLQFIRCVDSCQFCACIKIRPNNNTVCYPMIGEIYTCVVAKRQIAAKPLTLPININWPGSLSWRDWKDKTSLLTVICFLSIETPQDTFQTTIQTWCYQCHHRSQRRPKRKCYYLFRL